MPKHKCINFKNFSSKRIRLDTEQELEAENEETEKEESEDEETEDEAEGVSDDRRVRGREVSDEEIEGDIDSKEEKRIKERSFVWSHFKKITDDKNVIWAKCKYCR